MAGTRERHCARALYQAQVPAPTEKGGSQDEPRHACEPAGVQPHQSSQRNAAELPGEGRREKHVTPVHHHQGRDPGDWLGAREKPGEKPEKLLTILFHFHFEQVGPGEKTSWPRSAASWLESQLSPRT